MAMNYPDNVFLPPRYDHSQEPFIFLAGPIQGAGNWQYSAILLLQELGAQVHIASPRRAIVHEGDFDEEMYDEQVKWEHYHLDHAQFRGLVLFWLPREGLHNCSRAYAQTSRFELGEMCALHRAFQRRVVVGIDDGFSNARYLRKTLAWKYPGIPVRNSLRATCEAAVDQLREISQHENVVLHSG